MAINKKMLIFLTLAVLFSINSEASSDAASTVPPITVNSCESPGTIPVVIDVSKVTAVLVECDVNGLNALKTISINVVGNISVTNCTINKPVKLFFFNTTHNGTRGTLIKEDKSHLVTEITVVCNGSNMEVHTSLNSTASFPTAPTNIPLHNELTMEVRDINGSALITAVDIEQTYQLEITGPKNVYLLVESCGAASDLEFKNDFVELYVDKKPNEKYGVLGTFPSNITSKATTTMAGFRLTDFPVVYIRCVVDVCKVAGCPSLTTSTTTSTTTPIPTTTSTTTTTTTPTTTSTTTSTTTPTTTTKTTPTTTPTTTSTTTSTTTPTTTPPTTSTHNAAAKSTSTKASARRKRRNVDTDNSRVTLSTSFRVRRLFATSGAKGNTSGDGRYIFIASLLLTQYFLYLR